FLEVGVDHVVIGRLVGTGGLGLRFRLAGLVHRLAELHGDFGQRRGLFLDDLGVLAFEHPLEIGDRGLDRRLVLGRNLVAIVFERLLGRMDQRLALVLGFHRLALLLVGIGVLLGFLDHALDVGVGEAARSLDADLLLLAGALVLGRYLHDAV